MFWSFGTPTTDHLAHLLEVSSSATPTYDPAEKLPGFAHLHMVFTLGSDPSVVERSQTAFVQWIPHRAAGATIFPIDAPILLGTTLLVLLPKGPITAVAPCRITAVVWTQSRCGFTYVTLPGHPESGEESFYVSYTAKSGVGNYEVQSVSRPADRLLRIGSPVLSRMQRHIAVKYGAGMQQAVFARSTRQRPLR